MLTRAQFETAYAARSGVTVQQLRDAGRIVKPCTCGEDGCEGWQSVNADDYETLYWIPATTTPEAPTQAEPAAGIPLGYLTRDIPVTFNFGQRIGTARVNETGDGLTADIWFDKEPGPGTSA